MSSDRNKGPTLQRRAEAPHSPAKRAGLPRQFKAKRHPTREKGQIPPIQRAPDPTPRGRAPPVLPLRPKPAYNSPRETGKARMIRLVVIFLVGALIWMCWWAFGQLGYEKGLAAWVDDRRNAGWVANYAALDTRGFPNRFDTTLTDIELADPASGVAWSAPFVQFLSLAYKPHQVIAVLPERHRFSTPFQTVEITHSDARASLFLEASTLLGLDRARLVSSDLKLASTTGAEMSLDEGRFAAEALPGADHTYRVGAELLGLVPTDAAKEALDPGGVLPQRIEAMRVDADLTFTAPWDRLAIEEARPQLTRLKLKDLSARWGTVDFRAAGALDVDAAGVATGQITLRAEDWRRILDMAEAVGVLPPSSRGTVETALGLLAGPGDVLDVPLNFRDGWISLGIIPLGEAPRLLLR